MIKSTVNIQCRNNAAAGVRRCEVLDQNSGYGSMPSLPISCLTVQELARELVRLTLSVR